MPDITDPAAIQFSQDYLRPMAEMLAWFQSTGNNMLANWNGGKNALFPDTSDLILDENGTPRPFTGSNANNIVSRTSECLAVLNQPFYMDGVLPACVRPLGPSSGPKG